MKEVYVYAILVTQGPSAQRKLRGQQPTPPSARRDRAQKVGMKSCILSRAFCAMHSAIHVMLRISCSFSLM